MYTLTVDDRELIVTSMITILKQLDPNGIHLGATSAKDALNLAKKSPLDIAFLDVEMPGEMNGLSLGKQLKKRYPKLNIIIITGYKEYAINAFELDASGYLLKPITKDAVAHQLLVLRNKPGQSEKSRIRIRCFGTFEAFYNDTPLDFSYSKSKELLACLIDHNGAICSNDILIGCLWPNEPADQHTKARLRKYVKDLKDVFTQVGAENAILHQERVGISVDTSMFDCDYYRYLQGDPIAVHQFKGEYMSQYEFAEETRNLLSNK